MGADSSNAIGYICLSLVEHNLLGFLMESCDAFPKNTVLLQSKPNLIVRKILRSKKLTRILCLLISKRTLVSFSDVICISPGILKDSIIIPEPKIYAGVPCDKVLRGDVCEALPAPGVAVFENAEVRGGSNFIFLSDGRVLHHDLMNFATDRVPEEGGRQGLRFDVACGKIWCVNLASVGRGIAEGAVFCDGVARNYAHWLTEVLPRIALFYADPSRSGIPLIVDQGLHENIMASLRTVLPSQSKIYILPCGVSLSIKKLHYVHAVGYIPFEPRGSKAIGHSDGVFAPEAMKSMVLRIKACFPMHEAKSRRRIYVKRNSSIRHMVNSAEVEAMLVGMGFVVVEPEKLKFEEQVRIFHDAEVVVGATGAAMANLLFCRAPCRIVIFMSTHPDTPYYYWQSVATSVGLEVGYVLCPPASPKSTSFHCDFIVPMDLVGTVLEAEFGV